MNLVRIKEKNTEEKNQDQHFNQEKEIAGLLISQIEKLMNENESKLSDIKPSIEEKVLILKDAIEKEDLSLIQIAMDELREPVRIISARIYESPEKRSLDISCKICKTNYNLPPLEEKEKKNKQNKQKKT